MARSNDPNSANSQFFICFADAPHLDRNYTAFGKVVEGMDVVIAIANVTRDQKDKPEEDVVLEKINIIRNGSSAKKFDALTSFEKGAVDFQKAELEKQKAMQDQLNKVSKGAKKTPSGLMYKIEEKGYGSKLIPGDTVSVHYTGKLINGKIFDSSSDRGALKVILGETRLIPGFTEGITLLNMGAKATLIIPSNLGYGERGYPPVIPPNSVIIFEVEIVGSSNLEPTPTPNIFD